MLSLMGLVDQWKAIYWELPEGWDNVHLRLTVEDDARAARAAALLGPLNPGRHGQVIDFYSGKRGGVPAPELVRRLLARLDAERIRGEVELVTVEEAEPAPPATEAPRGRPLLVAQWDGALSALPDDWSDLYAEIELASSDYLERGALLLAPVNPARWKPEEGGLVFRFRVARRFGYGASGEMTRRCLERLDEEGIRGSVRVLYALSDTKPVSTQGPVWYVAGKVV